MNLVSAALSRGFSTTSPDTGADAATAPIALAPAGTAGRAWMRSSRGGPAAGLAVVAAVAGRAVATPATSSPVSDAVRATLRAMAARRFAGPARWISLVVLRLVTMVVYHSLTIKVNNDNE